jgi:hypothetical protein
MHHVWTSCHMYVKCTVVHSEVSMYIRRQLAWCRAVRVVAACCCCLSHSVQTLCHFHHRSLSSIGTSLMLRMQQTLQHTQHCDRTATSCTLCADATQPSCMSLHLHDRACLLHRPGLSTLHVAILIKVPILQSTEQATLGVLPCQDCPAVLSPG